MGSVYSQAVLELIHDGVNGWRFQPDSPGQLAELLSSLSEVSKEVKHRMQENALAAAELISPSRIADMFAEAIEDISK